jgi:hypothetical protein
VAGSLFIVGEALAAADGLFPTTGPDVSESFLP